MNKKLKERLVELGIAVLAGYIVVCLPAPSSKESQAPVWQEPRLLMVQTPAGLQELSAAQVSKPKTMERMRCADA